MSEIMFLDKNVVDLIYQREITKKALQQSLLSFYTGLYIP